MQSETPVIDSRYRICNLVIATEDAGKALNVILDELMRVLQSASSASIALLNPDTGQLEIEVCRGLPPKTEGFQLPLGKGVTGWVALHGSPMIVQDVSAQPNYVSLKPGVQSAMAVPMRIDGNVVGVININAEAPGVFGEADLETLTLLADEATRVMERLWMINRLKAQAEQLETLIGVGQRLVARRDLQGILDTITWNARRLLDYRMCGIFLFDPESGLLKLHSLSGAEGLIDYTEELAPEASAVGTAIRRKKQVEVSDLAKIEEHHFVPLIHRHGLVSLLSTPIIYEDTVIGVLNAYTGDPHRFNNEEKKLLLSFASLGAVAIENSRLYSKVFSGEEELRKSERLITLGMLSAEIAHEIRNPLTVIKLLFESLNLEFPGDDDRQRDIRIIAEKVCQLEAIVDRVLAFGRSDTSTHTPCAVQDLIWETLKLVRLKLEQSKVRVDCLMPDERLLVNVNKGQIQQVVLNLILNALQAMPDGGPLAIHVAPVRMDKGVGSVQVSIKDGGVGVPEAIRGRIFKPFLTSRNEGSGLGLAISHQIIKSHHGELLLLNSTDNGSTFQFTLPLAT